MPYILSYADLHLSWWSDKFPEVIHGVNRSMAANVAGQVQLHCMHHSWRFGYHKSDICQVHRRKWCCIFWMFVSPCVLYMMCANLGFTEFASNFAVVINCRLYPVSQLLFFFSLCCISFHILPILLAACWSSIGLASKRHLALNIVDIWSKWTSRKVLEFRCVFLIERRVIGWF